MTGMLCVGDKSFSYHARYAWVHEERKETYLQYVENYIRNTDKQDPCITVVDYGTCDGGNILPIFEAFAGFLKEQRSEKKLKCIFNDADHTVMPTLTEKIQESGLAREKHVTIETNVCDCYKPCLPSQSVDVAFCMFVLHWFSSPCPIKGGLFWIDSDEEEHKLIKLKAEEDWISFLKNRTNELKPGAYLFTTIPGHGTESSNLHTNARIVFRDMLTRNEISQEEFERTTIDIFMARTLTDIEKPFKTEINQLRLLDVTYKTFYYKDLGLTLDTMADYCKTWMYNGIMNGLSKERSCEEKKSVCDLYFNYLHKLFLQCDDYLFKGLGFNIYECVIQKHTCNIRYNAI